MFSFASRFGPVLVVLVAASACDGTTAPDDELTPPTSRDVPQDPPAGSALELGPDEGPKDIENPVAKAPAGEVEDKVDLA